MSGRPILIVDDDDSMRKLIALALMIEGYAVETAADGLDALEALDRGRPSLVLTDLHMPNLDGVGFVDELRSRGFDPPIVVMSATSRSPELVAEALDADACLPKPFPLKRLLSEVCRLRIP